MWFMFFSSFLCCSTVLLLLLSQPFASDKDEVVYEFPPFIRVYKDGHEERIQKVEFTPPSLDPSTGVSSKDVVIDPQTGLSARIFLPNLTNPLNKLPLLLYFHGGGFCIESAFSPTYHHYLNSLVAQANVVAVSVEYRKAPESPLPIAYEDAWTSLQWANSHSTQEVWFNKYVDFNKIFLAGDSAGANIAHNLAIRAGISEVKGIKINGVVLVHPLFSGIEPVGSEVKSLENKRSGELWRIVCPSTSGPDDPLINPIKDPNLWRLGCKKVLVCVAGLDTLRDRGRLYYETLGKCGWNGVVEFMESQGEIHVFHLTNSSSEKAKDLMNRVVSFLNTSDYRSDFL